MNNNTLNTYILLHRFKCFTVNIVTIYIYTYVYDDLNFLWSLFSSFVIFLFITLHPVREVSCLYYGHTIALLLLRLRTRPLRSLQGHRHGDNDQDTKRGGANEITNDERFGHFSLAGYCLYIFHDSVNITKHFKLQSHADYLQQLLLELLIFSLLKLSLLKIAESPLPTNHK